MVKKLFQQKSGLFIALCRMAVLPNLSLANYYLATHRTVLRFRSSMPPMAMLGATPESGETSPPGLGLFQGRDIGSEAADLPFRKSHPRDERVCVHLHLGTRFPHIPREIVAKMLHLKPPARLR